MSTITGTNLDLAQDRARRASDFRDARRGTARSTNAPEPKWFCRVHYGNEDSLNSAVNRKGQGCQICATEAAEAAKAAAEAANQRKSRNPNTNEREN